jgi:hypothetical protein
MAEAYQLDPRANQLLAALADDDYDRWSAHLEVVETPLGQVLFESGANVAHVYFPLTAIISLLYVMEDGGSAEMKGWSEYPCSWVVDQPQVGQSSKALDIASN